MTMYRLRRQPSDPVDAGGGTASAIRFQANHIVAVTLAIATMMLAMPAALAAEARFDPSRLIPLAFGMNEPDLDGDGLPDLVVKSWLPPLASDRTTKNSSRTIVTFLIYRDAHPEILGWRWTLNQVAFDEREQDDTRGETYFAGSRIGGCADRDFRLLKPERGLAQLVEAARDAPETGKRVGRVLFREFTLVVDREPEDGEPHYFQLQREWRTQRMYCDVNVAFRRELGLPCVGEDAVKTPGCASPRPARARR